MNTFKLVTNSTIDEKESYYRENDVACVALSFTLDEQTIRDGFDNPMPYSEFYSKLHEGKMCTTTQPSIEEYLEAFKSALDSGHDVLYVGFSSGLSGSYQAGCIAARDLASKHPERAIICVDTLSATGGMHILVDLAIALRDEGKSVLETAEAIEAVRLKIVHLVAPDDLTHLYRGGRLSKASAVVGTLVGIKPIIAIGDDGKLQVARKVRGRMASLQSMANQMTEGITDHAQTVFIAHADCLPDAEALSDYIKGKEPKLQVKILMLGAVLGAHGGPGTVVLSYLGQKRPV